MYPEFDDDKGVGVVFVHTEKGKNLFSSIEAEYMEVQYDEVVRANSSYYNLYPFLLVVLSFGRISIKEKQYPNH